MENFLLILCCNYIKIEHDEKNIPYQFEHTSFSMCVCQ